MPTSAAVTSRGALPLPRPSRRRGRAAWSRSCRWPRPGRRPVAIGARQAELAAPERSEPRRADGPAAPGRVDGAVQPPAAPAAGAHARCRPGPRTAATARHSAPAAPDWWARWSPSPAASSRPCVFGQPALLVLGGLGAARQPRVVARAAAHRPSRCAGRAASRSTSSWRLRRPPSPPRRTPWPPVGGPVPSSWPTPWPAPPPRRPPVGAARRTTTTSSRWCSASATVPWVPMVDGLARRAPPASVLAALAAHDRLSGCRSRLALRPGTVLGLVGDVGAARALARSLVRATRRGAPVPPISPSSSQPPAAAGRGRRWLPHRRSRRRRRRPRPARRRGRRRTARRGRVTGRAELAGMKGRPRGSSWRPTSSPSRRAAPTSPPSTRDGRRCRCWTWRPASPSTASSVPARRSRRPRPWRGRWPATTTPSWPPARAAGCPLPWISADVLGPGALDGAALAAAWRGARADPPLRAPLGRRPTTASVEIDLVDDGPHALVAGTTGAGKSELLRSAGGRPGGPLQPAAPQPSCSSTTRAAARSMPAPPCPTSPASSPTSTTGWPARALRSLEAELRRRERLLRDAGAADLADLPAARRRAGLPRLVDRGGRDGRPRRRAARLRARPRRRGPAGPQPRHPPRAGDAAPGGRRERRHPRQHQPAHRAARADGGRLPRRAGPARRRRAAARTGPAGRCCAAAPTTAVAVQVAHAGGDGVAAGGGPAVEVVPVGAPRPPLVDAAARRTLARLVGAAARRGRASGPDPPVAPPWLPPLPATLALEDLPPGAVGLADDPDHQAQHPVAWDPRRQPPVRRRRPGAAPRTALASLALALAADRPPRRAPPLRRRHGRRRARRRSPRCPTAPPSSPPPTGSARPTGAPAPGRGRAPPRPGATGPRSSLLVDGLPALRAAFDDPSGFAVLDALDASSPTAPPSASAWRPRPTGPAPSRSAVLAGFAPSLDVPGGRRAAAAAGARRRQRLRVGAPGRHAAATACRTAAPTSPPRWPPDGGPAPIGVLPTDVAARRPAAAARSAPDRWTVPIGDRRHRPRSRRRSCCTRATTSSSAAAAARAARAPSSCWPSGCGPPTPSSSSPRWRCGRRR